MVGTRAGAEELLGDSHRLAAVLDALRRPASGSSYTRWAASNELRTAGAIAAAVLRHCGGRREAAGLTRALLAAARAALPLQPEAAAALAEVLTQAEDDAAGPLIELQNIVCTLTHTLP